MVEGFVVFLLGGGHEDIHKEGDMLALGDCIIFYWKTSETSINRDGQVWMLIKQIISASFCDWFLSEERSLMNNVFCIMIGVAVWSRRDYLKTDRKRNKF